MSEVLPGTLLGGRYRLEGELGRGGMGSVWAAHDLQLDVAVALKLLDERFADKKAARARFEREAKAVARIRSSYVVHVYGHGIDGDVAYIAMELLQGEDLAKRLARERILSPAETIRIGSEIAKGLQRTHELDIVHRDLKPANVFLSEPDDDMVKLLDFGIARAAGIPVAQAERTMTGVLLGSPSYMSPEQLLGGTVDARTDLWALAVILFRALTGRRPFEGSEVGEIALRLCNRQNPRASALRPELPESIDAFFEQALCREPEGRFSSARELAAAFELALGGADASALVPPSARELALPPTSEQQTARSTRDPTTAASTTSPESVATAAPGLPDGPTLVAAARQIVPSLNKGQRPLLVGATLAACVAAVATAVIWQPTVPTSRHSGAKRSEPAMPTARVEPGVPAMPDVPAPAPAAPSASVAIEEPSGAIEESSADEDPSPALSAEEARPPLAHPSPPARVRSLPPKAPAPTSAAKDPPLGY